MYLCPAHGAGGVPVKGGEGVYLCPAHGAGGVPVEPRGHAILAKDVVAGQDRRLLLHQTQQLVVSKR